MIAFLKALFLKLFPPRYEDVAHAGSIPMDFRPDLHRQVASILRAALVGIKRDCLITDTSRWQLGINYEAMKSAGARGTILKAGQADYVDPYFKANWAKAAKAGIKRGSYFYYDSRVDPKIQAKTWADAIAADKGELPHFADYEESYLGPYRGIGNFLIFLEEFQRLSGLPDNRIGIYTGYFYWQKNGSQDLRFSRFWLWLAWYGSEIDVIVPKPWTQDRMWAWQFTSSGAGGIFGVSSLEIDLSYFIKGLDAFEHMYGDTPEPTPNTGETGMFKVWSNLHTMSLRRGAYVGGTTDNNFAEYVPKGTIMIADSVIPPTKGGLPGDKWAHVIEVNGVKKDLYVAIIHDGVTYCVYEPLNSKPNPTANVRFVDSDGKAFVGSVELKPE